MTRDEARFALQGPLREHFGCKIPEGVEDAWIDCWVAMGMLKLDEPKGIRERAIEALTNINNGVTMSWHGADICILKLNAAGLKIVEK